MNRSLSRLSLVLGAVVVFLAGPSPSVLHAETNEKGSETIPLWAKDTPFAKGDGENDQPKLERRVPAGAKNGAAIVVVPGGGYGGLAKDHEGEQIARFFNDLGFTAYILTYRLGTHGYHHPTQLNDVRRAVKLARSFAEKDGFSADKLGIIGFSAGGHLTSMAGTLFEEADPSRKDPVDQLSSRPDFMILCYPVITLNRDFTHMGSRNNLLGPEKDNDDLAKSLSSQLNVTDKTPPTFLFQTDADTAVPAENAVAFYLALRQHKVPAELHIYQHGAHGVGLAGNDPELATWSSHLKAWLTRNGFAPAAQ